MDKDFISHIGYRRIFVTVGFVTAGCNCWKKENIQGNRYRYIIQIKDYRLQIIDYRLQIIDYRYILFKEIDIEIEQFRG